MERERFGSVKSLARGGEPRPTPLQGAGRGVYTLLIKLDASINVSHRSGSYHELRPGLFAYTGSALGQGSSSLERRVERHLKLNKRRFWHIDDLLAAGGEVLWVAYASTEEKLEYAVNKMISSLAGSIIIRGFGSSDCGRGCGGHLVSLGERVLERAQSTLLNVYLSLGLDPRSVPVAHR